MERGRERQGERDIGEGEREKCERERGMERGERERGMERERENDVIKSFAERVNFFTYTSFDTSKGRTLRLDLLHDVISE